MCRVLSLNLLFALLLDACVTVNVNFPAAPAEESADPVMERVKNSSSGQLQTVGRSRPPVAARRDEA